MSAPELNPSIAHIPMPEGVKKLPIGPNSFPTPWFVAWIEGVPEFRAMDGEKLRRAIQEKRCWVCGEPMTTNRVTFVVGPMCTINRISAEPPSHQECAAYSVRACPFLSRPAMVRRENAMPEGVENPPGNMIARNPGVTCLWTTRNPGAELMGHGGGILFRLWPATKATFYREGRPATRAEVDESVRTGLPFLRNMAEAEGENAVEELERMTRDAAQYWPKELSGTPVPFAL